MIYAHFIPSDSGNIFVAQLQRAASSKAAILVVPPLFEELNLSAAVVSKTLQELPVSSYRFDYLGTGDSEKELTEVNTDNWLRNIIDTGQWLVKECGVEDIILLGVRFGALLQLANQQVLHDALPIRRQIVWKPITKGKILINQLMRLKHTNHTLAGGEKVEWRERIRLGETIEVAGYPLTESLLTSIETLNIESTDTLCSPLHWLELGTVALSPAIAKFQTALPNAQFKAVKCTSFWQTPELFEEPALYPVHREILGYD